MGHALHPPRAPAPTGGGRQRASMAAATEFTPGTWRESLRRSTGFQSATLGYGSMYMNAGKALGCEGAGTAFDFTGKYSLTGSGSLRPVRPVVSEHRPSYEACKFSKELYATLQQRRQPKPPMKRPPK